MSRDEIYKYLEEEEIKYRAVEAATKNMENSYRDKIRQRVALERQLGKLDRNCSSGDLSVTAQESVIASLQEKLDTALANNPSLSEDIIASHLAGIDAAKGALERIKGERDAAYAERDAFVTGTLNPQKALVEQAFHEYEAQYSAYVAARNAMIQAQDSMGFTQVAFPHAEPSEPSALPR